MNFLKKNIRIIIGFILGVILASSITVYAYSCIASDVKYTDTKTVAQALNELYEINNNDTYQNRTNPVTTSAEDSRIICSSYYDGIGGESGYSVFDRNDSTFWTSSLSESLPQYIGWDFGEKVIVYRFSIKNRSDMIDKNVLNFSLQGCNSNNQWEDIQSYTNTNMGAGGISNYDVSSPKKYSKYRINILSTSPTGTYVQVNQLDFFYLK